MSTYPSSTFSIRSPTTSPTPDFPAADRTVLGVPAGGDCPFREGDLALVC